MKILSCQNAKIFTESINIINKEDIIYNFVTNFEDNEINVKINNFQKLNNEDVLIIQSLSNDVNLSIIELLFTLDIVRSCTPKSISLLLTYMGYSRQDRIEAPNESFSAKVIANLLSLHYITRIYTINIHAQQTLGFFSIPAINISINELIIKLIEKEYNKNNVVLVSPDVGNIKNIIFLSDNINVDYNMAVKYRPKANENKILSMIGHDIVNKDCIIVDDIIDSAGTLCNVAEKLAQQGANSISAYITHPVLSKKSIDRLNNSHLTTLYIGNTIDSSDKIQLINNIEVFDLSNFCLQKILQFIN